jgi:GNAT superfamily N-acetyltransferase
MSLYTISKADTPRSIKLPVGLQIQECTDTALLAQMGSTTEEEVIKRLANDHVAFVAYMHGEPAAFGWMARGKAQIGELNHELILPIGNRYLWNFRTIETYRGLGIYPALLRYIIQYEAEKASRFWIIHAPENKASLKGIQKAGFQYVGKLYADHDGLATIESTITASYFQELLEQMNISLSEEVPASCWNCSSPYLKKRQKECCCAASANECVSNNLLALAS